MNLLDVFAFRVLQAFPPAEGAEGCWRPPVDLYETATDVIVELEIPGASPGTLRIVCHDQTLLVEGAKHGPASDPARGRFLCLERASGPFRRVLQLPGLVDRDRAEARYRDGVLTITLPKAHPGGRDVSE